MVSIRLARLPDRDPVKLSFSLSPEIHRLLGDYARFYRDAYGKEEPIAELVPAIIGSFIAGDRAFAAWLRQGKPGD